MFDVKFKNYTADGPGSPAESDKENKGLEDGGAADDGAKHLEEAQEQEGKLINYMFCRIWSVAVDRY
jgi:hypothetical protein